MDPKSDTHLSTTGPWDPVYEDHKQDQRPGGPT